MIPAEDRVVQVWYHEYASTIRPIKALTHETLAQMLAGELKWEWYVQDDGTAAWHEMLAGAE